MKSIIYYGGDIITVDEINPSVEAVFIKDGKIISVGKKEEVSKLKEEETEMYDLEGKTLLPGFIDPHSHIMFFAQTLGFQYLWSPPIGPVKNIEDIKNELRRYQEIRQIGKDQWIIGFGYDDSLLEEKRHPNKFDLDEVSTENPILIVHTSAHLAVVNSKALEIFELNSETKDPEGGVIQRIKGSNEPNGILEETAMTTAFFSLPEPTKEQHLMLLNKAQDIYLSYGITTAQDGLTTPMYFEVMDAASEEKRLKLDIVAYPSDEHVDSLLSGKESQIAQYQNRFKLGGAKLLLDGSPQGKTAWLTEPYMIPPQGQDKDYRGYPIHTDEKVYEYFKKCLENNWQVLVHCNGDAASDQFIKSYEKAVKDTGNIKDLRPVMIHAQTVREDQLDRMKELGIMPSYFVDHTYFWGDWHINSVLGKDRAYHISPALSTLKRNMNYTFHQDTPILPPNIIFTIWVAVNRMTRSGEIIGPDQRISVMDAIKAVTINGAYQYFEEDIKGSITVGKKADLVILDKNPLKVDLNEIKDIQVLETIKDGETVFRK